MLLFLILSEIFLLSEQNKYTQNYGRITEELLLPNLVSYNASIYCPNNKSKLFNDRERDTNIKIIRNNSKYKSFSSISINDKIDENVIKKFPKSTIFVINKENFDLSKINNNNNYSFTTYDEYIDNIENKSVFVGIKRKTFKKYNYLFIIPLILFSSVNIIIFCIFQFYYTSMSLKLEINNIANILHISSIFLSVSCILFRFIRLISLIYSIYKSYLIINIIYLLNGYKILYFQEQRTKRKIMITIFLATIDSIITIILLYIGISPEDIFYFFCGRNIIEDLIIFVIGIKMFLNNFINFYRQCNLERRIRTILILGYKYKLIIYSKVFIFALLYTLGTIIINIILIFFYNIKKDDYYYYYHNIETTNIYYINISIEIFFSIIFSIMFFPNRNSLLVFLESDININIYLLTEIKKDKEKNMQINNLNKNILKHTYYNNEYPLIMLEPFVKTNNFLNGSHIHIGITKLK